MSTPHFKCFPLAMSVSSRLLCPSNLTIPVLKTGS